ncbi:MAG: ABC transporter ATP-binding protein, partial [Oscillochloris sp.]|nr:ABC transporter ATP-binding protein [Oscillochloris sp.]
MSTDSTDVIEIEDLSKSYGSLQVLRGLSLRVAAGEVYGLLGPNGAGKSTLLHLMLGFLKPSSGNLRILGSRSLDGVHAQIGYIPERQRYHTRYTAREYLRFIGEFSGLRGTELSARVDQELRTVGLEDDANRMLSNFSKGMLQRVGVAQALLCDPALLLIDEPTSGLDPSGQREILDLLAAVRDRGHTVFLCTHYL